MTAAQFQKRWVGLTLALMCIGVSVPAAAQTFPSKPVRIVVAFPAGGGVDMVARLLASKLSEKWAQPVFVENKSGASGYIGTNLVATSPADGYNVTISVPNTFTIGPHLITPPYDALKDFTPITMIITFPNVLVIGPKVQAKPHQPVPRQRHPITMIAAAAAKRRISISGKRPNSHSARWGQEVGKCRRSLRLG